MTEFTLDDTGIKLPGPVTFEPGSDKLTPASDASLEVVDDYLEANPDVTVLRIEGHTGDDGPLEGNLVLSQKRALNVARWLVGVGVKCSRLLPVGFGPTSGLVRRAPAGAQAASPRVAFQPVTTGAAAGGGKPAGDPCR